MKEYLNQSNQLKEGFIYKNYSPGGKEKRKYLSEENAKKIDKPKKLRNIFEYFFGHIICQIAEMSI